MHSSICGDAMFLKEKVSKVFPWLLKGKADEMGEFGPAKKEDYAALHQALKKIGEAKLLKGKSDRDRLYHYLSEIDCPKRMRRVFMRVHADPRGKHRSILKSAECKVALEFFKKQGLLAYDEPVFALAGHPDMLFHALEKRAGKSNLSASHHEIREVYEMYTIDVAHVLANMGRYYLLRGCMEVVTDPKTGVTHVNVSQPGGAAPGSPFAESYSGHLFLQDDTAYVMSFKDIDKNRDLIGKASSNIRRNMAAMVLSGLSRNANGLYDKFVGGQVGRGLTGATGVLYSPCVFYRVSDEHVRDMDRELAGENDNQTGQKMARLATGEVSHAIKWEVLKRHTSNFGIVPIHDGVDPGFVSVMSDLNIPVPMADEPRRDHATRAILLDRDD